MRFNKLLSSFIFAAAIFLNSNPANAYTLSIHDHGGTFNHLNHNIGTLKIGDSADIHITSYSTTVGKRDSVTMFGSIPDNSMFTFSFTSTGYSPTDTKWIAINGESVDISNPEVGPYANIFTRHSHNIKGEGKDYFNTSTFDGDPDPSLVFASAQIDTTALNKGTAYITNVSGGALEISAMFALGLAGMVGLRRKNKKTA